MRKFMIVMSLVATTLNLFAGDNIEAKKIFESSKQKLSLKNVHLVLDLETSDAKGNEKAKSLDVSFAEFGNDKKVMIEVMSPENIKGTKILTTDFANQKGIIEIYMPATGKIQKLRASQRNLKILGSEIPINQFSTAIEGGFDFNIVGQQLVNGAQCYQIKVQKADEKGYEIAYVSVDKEQLMRIETYDNHAKLITQTELLNYMKIANVGSKMYPREIRVENFKNGKSSFLKVRHLDYLSNINSGDFKLNVPAS